MKKKTKSRSPIQRHHIIYESDKQSEFVVPMYKGEHYIISQMQRRKYFSKGFITSLKAMLPLMEYSSENLEEFV